MRGAGLAGVSRRKGARTTQHRQEARPAPDLVDRNFTAELGTTAARLSAWREAFLRGGEAALKARPADERDEENARLKAKVGELTMEGEVLREKIDRLEAGRPLAGRRWRR